MRAKHLARLAAAAAAGERERLAPWYRAALADGVPAADLQELTLQVFLFAGFPRTIDAFEALGTVVGGPPLTEPPLDDPARRGREVFARIYGPHVDKVLAMLGDMHPDFRRFTLENAYGQVLGRPFLPIGDREIAAVAMLAAMGLRRQLRAHVRGALRVGVSCDDVRAALAGAEEAVGALPEAREIIEKALTPP